METANKIRDAIINFKTETGMPPRYVYVGREAKLGLDNEAMAAGFSILHDTDGVNPYKFMGIKIIEVFEEDHIGVEV